MSQQFVNGTTQIFILELEVLDWLENIEPKTWDGMINSSKSQNLGWDDKQFTNSTQINKLELS